MDIKERINKIKGNIYISIYICDTVDAGALVCEEVKKSKYEYVDRW